MSPRRTRRWLVLLAVLTLCLGQAACSKSPDETTGREDAARKEAEAARRLARLPDAGTGTTATPSGSDSFRVAYDKSSVRFLDEQLVIDLALTNRTPHLLQDVTLKIECPPDNGRPEWKKEVTVGVWPAGKEERVIVPLIDNDLEIEEREADIGPQFEYALSGSYRDGGQMRTLTATNQGPVRSIRIRLPQPGAAPIRDTWKTCLTGSYTRRGDAATMTVDVKRLGTDIPSLTQVQMLVVGYSETGELFRKRVARDVWAEADEWAIEVPAGDVARLRFRGVGKRRITSADDLEKQQVYYICENWRMNPAK